MSKWLDYTSVAAGTVADADIVPFADMSETAGTRQRIATVAVLRAVLSGASNVAAVDPVVGDDDADGYRVGSFWLNSVSSELFVCTDATTGAAVWANISAGVLTASSTTTFTNKTLSSFTNTIAADDVHFQVKNETGVTLTAGTPVYVSGYNVGADLIEVSAADASVIGTMPAIGIMDEDVTTGSAGSCTGYGTITGLNTAAWSVGDELFVSETAGTLTTTEPTYPAKVQPIAVVVRSNVATGILLVRATGLDNGIKAGEDAADLGSGAATDGHVLTADGAGGSAWEAVPGATAPSLSFVIACSDETTALTTGAAKATFRMPYAFTLTAVRASVTTAPTGAAISVGINEGGVSILSTDLTIDATEKTSTTAATAAVISDTALADDAEITIDLDLVGSTIAGAGMKVTLIGTKT